MDDFLSFACGFIAVRFPDGRQRTVKPKIVGYIALLPFEGLPKLPDLVVAALEYNFFEFDKAGDERLPRGG